MSHGCRTAALAIGLGTFLSVACGYSLAGRGSFLPASIRTIGIPLFTNATPFYELELALTERVRSEFIGRGKYTVLPQEAGVDAVLRGEVTNITLTPAAFNDQQQATRYAITMTAKMEFRDLAANKVIWENPALVFREEYEVTSGGSATDPKLFFGQDANALQRVAQDFARTVVSAILEAF